MRISFATGKKYVYRKRHYGTLTIGPNALGGVDKTELARLISVAQKGIARLETLEKSSK